MPTTPTHTHETALAELVDKIIGTDSGDLLADAAQASRQLDAPAILLVQFASGAWHDVTAAERADFEDQFGPLPCRTLFPAPEGAAQPDYAWPTPEDYEREVGFEVNLAFKMAWKVARTTNSFFKEASAVASADPRCAGCDLENGCPEFCKCNAPQPLTAAATPAEVEKATAKFPTWPTDPLQEPAETLVLSQGRASIQLVQRHLRISYNHAARLIEAMEAKGLIAHSEKGYYLVATKPAAEGGAA